MTSLESPVVFIYRAGPTLNLTEQAVQYTYRKYICHNGTVLQMNGTVLQMNGTVLQINGTVLQINGTVLQMNGTVLQMNDPLKMKIM